MNKESEPSPVKSFCVMPIGRIHTAFSRAEGTPIQSAVAGEAVGVIEVFAQYAEGLRDLAGFERIWLFYLFDRASQAKLLARPYLDTAERGIFATRSPARPNHIGLSSVRLLAVEGNRLHVAGVDMLDGTPLIDIKPYVPAFDHFDVTRIGWYEGKSAEGVKADGRFEASEDQLKEGL
jgi:tRNA-Thr(GGU) m(6)t(6)A37 methyltransferase TsaA